MGGKFAKIFGIGAMAMFVALALVLIGGRGPTPAQAAATVSTVPPPGTYGLAVFSGGTFDALTAAAQAAGCAPTAFYVNSQGGGLLAYVVATTVSAVNAPAKAAYPSGLPALSPVMISCGAVAPPVATPTAPTGGAPQVAVTLSEFSIAPVPVTVSGGQVTFSVTNKGVVTHEMVLAQTDADPAALPTLKASDPPVEGHAVGDVNEAVLTSPGEVDDVAAGTTKTGTLTLDPGKYVLFCNVPGHFAAGMHTAFTVTAPTTPPPATPPSAAVAVAEKEWSIGPTPATVKAGPVALTVTNSGVHAHELVVIKTDVDQASLPTLGLSDADVPGQIIGDVNEASLTTLGNITTAAGATKGLTIPLDAGKYVLFCNLPGHYAAGMHAAFTVQ
jgi:uncharacterized cupredoxin-like copper-binding protein